MTPPVIPPAGQHATSPPEGTFTAAPGSAPLRRQVRAQTLMETRLMVRNGEQLLLAVVIPLLVLVAGVTAIERQNLSLSYTPIDTLAPGVLALAIMSTAFTSLAISTGFERRYGVIKRLGASPLPRHGLLLGKVGALLLVLVVQMVVLGGAALLMGWAPEVTLRGVTGALAVGAVGTAAFASLGLLIAGALRAEATLAVANLIYLLLAAGGAVVLPASVYGGAEPFLRWLPSGALGGGLREALLIGTFPLAPALVLLLWTVVGAALTARTFRWE
jgi:ABC-2 type transport system permease protein